MTELHLFDKYGELLNKVPIKEFSTSFDRSRALKGEEYDYYQFYNPSIGLIATPKVKRGYEEAVIGGMDLSEACSKYFIKSKNETK